MQETVRKIRALLEEGDDAVDEDAFEELKAEAETTMGWFTETGHPVAKSFESKIFKIKRKGGTAKEQEALPATFSTNGADPAAPAAGDGGASATSKRAKKRS